MAEKVVTGICQEVVQKPGSDWVEFHIDAGSKYPVRVATKQQPLIELARAAGTRIASWTYNEVESEKVNPNSGKPYINRYLKGVEVGGSETGIDPNSERAVTTTSPSSVVQAPESPTPVGLIGAEKDRAIARMNAMSTAAALYGAVLGGKPEDDAASEVAFWKVVETARRIERFVHQGTVLEEEVPF